MRSGQKHGIFETTACTNLKFYHLLTGGSNEAETFGKFVDEHPVALRGDSADDLPERFHAYMCSTLLIEATSIKLCRLVEEVWFRKLPRVVAVTFANTLSLYKKSEFSICNELKYNQDKFVETWNKHHENEPPITPDEVKV